jgi:predicted metal-dependent phosphoesterase TrpH
MDLSHGVADLHMHTVASDGTSTLSERLDQARDRNLDIIAITDHDSIPERLSRRVEQTDEVTVITGVEVRADLDGSKVELLGYFVDPDAVSLQQVLEQAREYRKQRNRALADRLVAETELTLSHEELSEQAPGMLGRPHFAQELVDAGVVDSIGAAFERYLGEDGAAYVPMDRVPHQEVIDAIHDAGGLVSMAHPGRMDRLDVPAAVETLTDAGMDALEVYYPYNPAPVINVETAATLADEHDLLRTGGSDCHGPGSGKFHIGEVRLSADEFERLCEAAGVSIRV